MSLDIATQVKSLLKTSLLGRELHYYPRLSTTMDTARELARKGAEEGTVIMAGTQTAGKGRIGRSWFSPEGSLAMSVILKPPLKNLPQLIMIASLAVVSAIRTVSGLDAAIKWPNDVMIKGRKVCGILIENEVEEGKVNYADIGIGINANFEPADHPEIADISTGLSHESGRQISVVQLAAAVIDELERLYIAARNGDPVHRDWRRHMETLGKRIKVDTGQSIEHGIAESVNENGNLILRRDDGSPVEIVVGDVSLIKE